MTDLERALKHIKIRADAWAVKEVEKALSQEPTDDKCHYCEHTFTPYKGNTGEFTEQEPCDDTISREAVLDGLRGCICSDEWVKTLFATMVKQLPSVTQKPIECDDSISREAVLEQIGWWIGGKWNESAECLRNAIKQLPSVTQKSSRWKVHRKYYECSSCGSQISNEFFVNYRFCPHCGAKMVEPQESEEQTE